MNTEILGVILMYALTILLAYPLGKYIANVFAGERTLLDPVFNPLEKFFFRISRIDSTREMDWKEYMIALLTINIIWFLFGMLVMMNMGWRPLNLDGNPSMPADQAFNTVVSFVSNTNLQHYSGETGVSYLGQLVLQLFQFISAGAGIAAAIVVFVALKERNSIHT